MLLGDWFKLSRMASRCTGGCHQRAPCIGRAIASWSISRTAQSSASSTARSCAARCGVPPWRRPRRSHRGATAGMLQQREDTAAGPDPFAPTGVGQRRQELLVQQLRRGEPRSQLIYDHLGHLGACLLAPKRCRAPAELLGSGNATAPHPRPPQCRRGSRSSAYNGPSRQMK